ncbi:MAG: hypothetical protein ACQEXX_01245 [Bacillota bacterium]
MDDNNTYFGTTVRSDEDVEFKKVLSGEVNNEIEFLSRKKSGEGT